MNKILVITLKSDLCAAVGKHYAAMIDLDTALDAYGLPFIPSRRLKGCLKEVAGLILPQADIDRLFGVSGRDDAGTLRIADAKIEEYESICAYIQSNTIQAEEISELYCSVRGQTAIDNTTGTADDQSLRYIRVVNHYAPDESEMQFFAPISFEEQDEEKVESLCKVLRNIGYSRNRGLGAVHCTLVEPASTDAISGYNKDEIFDKNTTYEITYTVKLEADLMLPANDANHSRDYIPGTTVLGAFAGKYLRRNSSFDNDLFLTNNVKFGNLYIADYDEKDKTTTSYIPSPKFIAKVKAAQENKPAFVNIIAQSEWDYRWKVVKNGYFNFEKGEKKPEEKIVYHNNLADKKDGGLYMQYCLSGGQYFSGSIVAKGAYAETINALLGEGTLYFGRSKGAQYARCSVCHVEYAAHSCAKEEAAQGSIAAFVLESDAILTDEKGVNTADMQALLQAITGAAGVPFAEEHLRSESAISAKIISGYNAKWNLKKPQCTAIAAGSCLVVNIAEGVKVQKTFYIGEKQNEGFGKVRFIPNAGELTIAQGGKAAAKPDAEEPAFAKIIKANRRDDKLIAAAIGKAKTVHLRSAQVGRLLLMCKEAETLDDFQKRIGSIKGDELRAKAEQYFSNKQLVEDLAAIGITGQVEWKVQQSFIKYTLTVAKYALRKEKQS